MPHLLLIVEPLGQREARGVQTGQAAYQQMLDFTEELQREGALMASSALATAATRLQRLDRPDDVRAMWQRAADLTRNTRERELLLARAHPRPPEGETP